MQDRESAYQDKSPAKGSRSKLADPEEPLQTNAAFMN